jgi:ribonuclease-3 family protein
MLPADEKKHDTHTSTAALAYLGDAVFELRVREVLLARNKNGTSHTLTRLARKYVNAEAQAAMYHVLFPVLTEDEQTIMKRGRNLHTSSRAKNADVTAYRHATGLEVLFGYLYERGEFTRLDELFAKIL